MSNARKCNRCGVCFDPRAQGLTAMAQFRNPIFQSSEDIRSFRVGSYLIEDSKDEIVDLCPECTEKFRLFMDGCPLGVERNKFDAPDIKDPLMTDAQQELLGKLRAIGRDIFGEM